MGDGENIDSAYGIVALSIAECFGTEAVSVELATSLSKLLPQATFLRLVVFCAQANNMHYTPKPHTRSCLTQILSPTELQFAAERAYSLRMTYFGLGIPWSA